MLCCNTVALCRTASVCASRRVLALGGVGLRRFIDDALVGIRDGGALVDASLRLGAGDRERRASLPTALEAVSWADRRVSEPNSGADSPICSSLGP